jgi:hypothetical protein
MWLEKMTYKKHDLLPQSISLPSSREYNRCKVFLYIGYSELKITGFLRWAVGKSGRIM